MTCPDCANPLSQARREGVLVDECHACGGTWFDRDELRRAKDSADEDLRWLDFDVFADGESFTATSSERLCPRCSRRMDSLTYMDSNVVIDACPSGHGVWLDHGEFHRIVEHLEHLVVSIDAREFRRRALEELREMVSGPEGKISELKDFLTVTRLLQYRIGVERPVAASAINELSRRL